MSSNACSNAESQKSSFVRCWSARELAPSHVDGRFVAETRHEGQDWAVVLEPDFDLECVAVVTVYSREETWGPRHSR